MTYAESERDGRRSGLLVTAVHTGLLTDLYHPDAAYVSWRAGMNGVATFDLYARRAPFGGSYMLVAGVEQAIRFITEFGYTDADLAYLSSVRSYDPGFLDELKRTRFTGDVWAMPEGTVAFPNEPILRVTAPFRQALLVESGLLQAANLATLLATKAARITRAARGKRVADFAFRRAQEPFTVARSAYIGGCVSTSFLAAAYEYGLPATGTIPHALVELFPTEHDAFASVAESFDRYTVLLDTYNPRHAIHTAADVARRVKAERGHELVAVRLDGGDLKGDSVYVRRVLDEAGLPDVAILVSGDLDEFSIADLEAAGAPIDGYGVGTSLGVGAGSAERGIPGGALGGVYKLVDYVDASGTPRPKVKVAGEKSTWPGIKQVYRVGRFHHDVIALTREPAVPDAAQLLVPAVLHGEVQQAAHESLPAIAARAKEQLVALPERYARIEASDPYRVEFSADLVRLLEEAVAAVRRIERGGRASPA